MEMKSKEINRQLKVEQAKAQKRYQHHLRENPEVNNQLGPHLHVD